MTIEEIRKNAPKGANYFSQKYGYLRKSCGDWFKWNGREFIQFYIPVNDFSRIS